MFGLAFLVMSLLSSVSFAAVVDDYPMRAREVAPGVYAVLTPARDFPNPENRGWNSNSAFVVTGDGVLVFDTGSSQTIGEALKRSVASVTDQPVRWVVNSHGHGDHWLGNAAFQSADLTVFASEQVTARIRSEGAEWIDRFGRMTDGATGTSEIVVPNATVTARTEHVLGGVRMVFMPSGDSHSPGDVVVWLPERRVLLAGDVVYSDRMPSTFDANVQQWITFLGELEELQPNVVVPGHGDVTDVSAIRRQREFLTAFWEEVQSGYDAGKTDFEMQDDVRAALLSFREYYPGFDDKLGRDLSHVYLQVEAAAF